MNVVDPEGELDEAISGFSKLPARDVALRAGSMRRADPQRRSVHRKDRALQSVGADAILRLPRQNVAVAVDPALQIVDQQRGVAKGSNHVMPCSGGDGS